MQKALGNHPNVVEIRGLGMLCAVEFARDPASQALFEPSKGIGAKVAGALLGEGIIARTMPQGDILGFAPPLCLTRNEADRIVEATRRAVASTHFA